MVDKKLFINIVIYDILIDFGKLTMARELFCSLLMKGMQPNVQTYTIMIKGCQEGLIDEARELLEGMVVHLMIAHITQSSKGYCNIMRPQRQRNISK